MIMVDFSWLRKTTTDILKSRDRNLISILISSENLKVRLQKTAPIFSITLTLFEDQRNFFKNTFSLPLPKIKIRQLFNQEDHDFRDLFLISLISIDFLRWVTF